jgi:hypothetical protein
MPVISSAMQETLLTLSFVIPFFVPAAEAKENDYDRKRADDGEDGFGFVV